jgi:hypothetical protein
MDATVNATNSAVEATHSDIERSIKEVELQLKKAELKNKLNSFWTAPILSSPFTITVITGVLGLIGAEVANVVQARSNLQLERDKFQSSLILKAIETGNPTAATTNLLFLLRTGLITDPTGKIAALQNRPQDGPVLPSSSGAVVPHTPASRELFFSAYNARFAPLSSEQKVALSEVFDQIESQKGISDVRHVAYVLATIKWETGNSWRPISEAGKEAYFDKYGPGTPIGKTLGNTDLGDGFRYRGRGYLAVTGRGNYQRLNQALGLADTEDDLVKYPEKMLNPRIAYRVTERVMMEGILTGMKLSDYIYKDHTDYLRARRIVSGGLDHTESIAETAKQFEALLRVSLGEK